MKRGFIALAALSLVVGTGVFAQDSSSKLPSTGDGALDSQVADLDAQHDSAALLALIAAKFNVSVDVLSPYLAQGYRPGEIWLALELSKVSGKSLDEVIALATKDGHGWGVVAASLGIKPGSAEFKALKGIAGKDGKEIRSQVGKAERADAERADAGKESGKGSESSRNGGDRGSGGSSKR
jgi:hypothetical protein